MVNLETEVAQVAPSRARGLKPAWKCLYAKVLCRALTGARIETNATQLKVKLSKVAPSRARGLKPKRVQLSLSFIRRALTGARIETVNF